MIRLLLFFATLGALLYLLLTLSRMMMRRWLKRFVQQHTQPTQTPSLGEKLTQCQYCHTFIPISQAINTKGRYYCSQEHAKL